MKENIKITILIIAIQFIVAIMSLPIAIFTNSVKSYLLANLFILFIIIILGLTYPFIGKLLDKIYNKL